MAGMRSRQRMFAAVMRLLLKCLRLGRRRRFKLVRQAEQLWHYGHLCLRSLLYNSFTNGDVVLDSLFEPIYWLVDHVTRWFGVVFVALVIGLTSSIVAIVYICLLPLILQTYTPAWICWHLAYGHWNLIMIVFHYYMAITTSPGHPPQEMHCPQASSHPPLQHLQQVRAEDGPPLPLAKQLCRTLQPPLLLLLLPVHDHGLHLLQHQRLGDVPGCLRSHRDVLPDPATHLLLPPASFPQERGLPLGPLQCGTLPSSPVGKPASSGTSTRRRGRDCRRKARSSGTPTVMGAGIIGRCSWVWTCQGKAPGKPLLGRWWLSSTWRCWDRGSPWAAGAEQDSKHSLLSAALGFARHRGPVHQAALWLLSPAQGQALAYPAPLCQESQQRSTAIMAARGHGLTALAQLCRAEKHQAFRLLLWPHSSPHRHWLTRVLLPSPHLPHGTGLSWDLPPCVTKQRAPLLAI
ncbi:palmitoyltransferase ZDHHC16 isoform X4 [Buteo buteo]|uniref:palmitoyltransferase ZDHHC16 isoform X4 n=1 Tax=Buteo buteo TaxID=30397 RepID=UPI003EBEBDCE